MNGIYLMLLSVMGFCVSFYIYHSKKKHKPIVCILGKDCDFVINSKYGRTFGVENTIAGMSYYTLIFACGLLVFLNRNIFKYTLIYYFVVSASSASVLFSAYLAVVQAFVLKKWCEYCITSSIISALILALIII